MKKLLVMLMSVMLILSISQAYVVTIYGPNCTFKMSTSEGSEIILSDLKDGIRWWEVKDDTGNTIGVINNEFVSPKSNVSVKPKYEGNQIVVIQTENGAIKYNENKVNTVETTEGGNYTFTIEADTGYEIKSLIIDGIETTASSSYTFKNVNENHTIKATFEKIIPILSKDWYGTPTVGETTIEKSSITSISLVDSYTPIGEVATSWNASSNQADGILTAYLEADGSENGTYKITIAGNGSNTIRATYCFSMFSNFTNATEINGLSMLDTSKVEYMTYMFYNCCKVAKLDVSNFDTSNVVDTGYMFENCKSLVELDVSGFNTSKVESMVKMFQNCNSLTKLDVSHFDTSKVGHMWHMFTGCSSLTELDVSNFNTSKITSMQYMFKDCSKLTELDVSNFDTSNVTNMWCTFYGCSSLTELNLSKFDTINVTNMDSMFSGTNSLKQITLGKDFSFYGANKGVEGASVLTTLSGTTWYDEEGNSYTATEIAELENPSGTYYTTNPVQ